MIVARLHVQHTAMAQIFAVIPLYDIFNVVVSVHVFFIKCCNPVTDKHTERWMTPACSTRFTFFFSFFLNESDLEGTIYSKMCV